ncbi:hypothetical protein BH09BAC6_BH09BAC6_09270 [soil metagenome]
MKPFIFQFKEAATEIAPDYSAINYSNELNLSIDSLTGAAAIESVNMETETFTKADYEAADTDRNGFSALMETETRTFTQTEASDSDQNRPVCSSLLETSTNTRKHQEVTDSDRS